MKTLHTIERVILTGLVALTLGIGLAPRAHAAVTSDVTTMLSAPSATDVLADKPKAGEETHG